jgi:hypothetical protein
MEQYDPSDLTKKIISDDENERDLAVDLLAKLPPDSFPMDKLKVEAQTLLTRWLLCDPVVTKSEPPCDEYIPFRSANYPKEWPLITAKYASLISALCAVNKKDNAAFFIELAIMRQEPRGRAHEAFKKELKSSGSWPPTTQMDKWTSNQKRLYELYQIVYAMSSPEVKAAAGCGEYAIDPAMATLKDRTKCEAVRWTMEQILELIGEPAVTQLMSGLCSREAFTKRLCAAALGRIYQGKYSSGSASCQRVVAKLVGLLRNPFRPTEFRRSISRDLESITGQDLGVAHRKWKRWLEGQGRGTT